MISFFFKAILMQFICLGELQKKNVTMRNIVEQGLFTWADQEIFQWVGGDFSISRQDDDLNESFPF